MSQLQVQFHFLSLFCGCQSLRFKRHSRWLFSRHSSSFLMKAFLQQHLKVSRPWTKRADLGTLSCLFKKLFFDKRKTF